MLWHQCLGSIIGRFKTLEAGILLEWWLENDGKAFLMNDRMNRVTEYQKVESEAPKILATQVRQQHFGGYRVSGWTWKILSYVAYTDSK